MRLPSRVLMGNSMAQLSGAHPLWYTVAMLISIVVPCFNEEEALPHFTARFDHIADRMDVSFELLLVNDGSKDGTLALARALARADGRVRVLSLSRNFGKEAALLSGLSHAAGDLVAVMDADLQDPPDLLPKMLQRLEETGCDCVATRRVTRAGEPPVRSLFARVFYRLINRLSPVRVEDGVRDFRLMRREMVDAILRLSEKRRFSKGLFSWVGFDVCLIEYENVERVAGVTKWSFWGLLRYALEGVFSLTDAPLSLAFVFSALTLLSCLVLLCLSLWLPAGMCAAASAVLLSIGLFGQYLARAYWETKKRPLYVEKSAGHKERRNFS